MQIKVNGKIQKVEKTLTITELLALNQVEMPDMVSVQLNGDFVKRESFPETSLKENDEVDFLYFMGGGA